MKTESSTRFGGVERLFSREGRVRLARAHVAVIGVGGVGSWAAEALARSGVGTLTLVDLDDVCESNINRQVHAIEGTVGRPKVAVMAERIRQIHPGCVVLERAEFFTSMNAQTLLEPGYSYVVDAIDDVDNKCLLIALCREGEVPLVVCGGAGGKRDGTAIRVDDLTRASHDRLLQKVREQLRRVHGFPRGELPFGVAAVFSVESPVFPRADGTVCAERESGGALRLNCDTGFGTAAFVTGAFGFAAAGEAVRHIAETPQSQ